MGKSKNAGPLRAVSPIVRTLWVLGCKPLWFAKLDVLRACLSIYILKVGMPDVGFEPFFTPQGEAPGSEFPPNYGTLCQCGVYGETVSQPPRSLERVATNPEMCI